MGAAFRAFDAAKHPRGSGGKFGATGASWIGRIDSKERRRRVQAAVAEAQKYLTGEKRPEWYSPQKIAEHGGRFNRDPHEAYQSELDAQLRWALVHPETEKYAGDAAVRKTRAARRLGAAERVRRARIVRKG